MKEKASFEQNIKELYVKGATVAEKSGQIDLFYADTANVRIPLLEAYVFGIKRIKGEDPQEIEREVASLRRFYNR